MGDEEETVSSADFGREAGVGGGLEVDAAAEELEQIEDRQNVLRTDDIACVISGRGLGETQHMIASAFGIAKPALDCDFEHHRLNRLQFARPAPLNKAH